MTLNFDKIIKSLSKKLYPTIISIQHILRISVNIAMVKMFKQIWLLSSASIYALKHFNYIFFRKYNVLNWVAVFVLFIWYIDKHYVKYFHVFLLQIVSLKKPLGSLREHNFIDIVEIHNDFSMSLLSKYFEIVIYVKATFKLSVIFYLNFPCAIFSTLRYGFLDKVFISLFAG